MQSQMSQDLALWWAKKMKDPNLLTKCLKSMNKFKWSGSFEVLEVSTAKSSDEMVKSIQLLQELYKQDKDPLFVQATQDWIKLLQKKEVKNSNINSVHDLILRILKAGKEKDANAYASYFKIPEKRMWHLRLKAYADLNEWIQI